MLWTKQPMCHKKSERNPEVSIATYEKCEPLLYTSSSFMTPGMPVQSPLDSAKSIFPVLV
jgi:hypothetical protein